MAPERHRIRFAVIEDAEMIATRQAEMFDRMGGDRLFLSPPHPYNRVTTPLPGS